MNHYRKLLRIEQWYKNLLIFSPYLFASEALPSFPILVLAFFGLCSISSLTYIVNDWRDRNKDRLHPVKKNRPLASGKVSGEMALALGLLLGVFTLFTLTRVGGLYPFAILAYALLTTAYSFGLKNIPFIDILIIGINFTLRAVAGLTILPHAYDLPYFTFLFALILLFLTHKRRSDIKLLGTEKAIAHKPVLAFYTRKVCYSIRVLAYLLILASFYNLFQEGWSPYPLLAIFALLFYTSTLFVKKPELVISPHYLLKDKLWDFLLLLCGLSPILVVI